MISKFSKSLMFVLSFTPPAWGLYISYLESKMEPTYVEISMARKYYPFNPLLNLSGYKFFTVIIAGVEYLLITKKKKVKEVLNVQSIAQFSDILLKDVG